MAQDYPSESLESFGLHHSQNKHLWGLGKKAADIRGVGERDRDVCQVAWSSGEGRSVRSGLLLVMSKWQQRF